MNDWLLWLMFAGGVAVGFFAGFCVAAIFGGRTQRDIDAANWKVRG